MRRLATVIATTMSALFLVAAPAAACGGLIGPNGAVNLLRTTTFAAYHDGLEHYITAFEFAGGGEAFGSITPLPGVPSDVEKGGDWTLQRLLLETNPLPQAAVFESRRFRADGDDVEVLLETRIDALDITVLRGGGEAVAEWATERGFQLSDDAPGVLDFYAQRSPIFLAAVFDGQAAAERGQVVGDGTPVHITIPTPDPWVPLRILGLGKPADEIVQADIYLLTDQQPTMLPAVRPIGTSTNGLILDHSAHATAALLDDLRSDTGMGWVPQHGWLTKIRVDARAGDLRYDLAIDATGRGTPSRVAAGLDPLAGDLEVANLPLLPLLALMVVGGSALAATRRVASARSRT
jgi:hypothetical protein